MACAMTLASCDDDDSGYVPQPVDVSNGAFILNSGNKSGGVSSSLTYVDYSSQSVRHGLFSAANARALGMTANDLIIYGDKMYIVVTGENTVEVVNKNTMASLAQIKLAEVIGEDKGAQPRHAVAGKGKVFVSTFTGYVAQIDTTSLSVEKTYQAGSYPEGMEIEGNTLYVANSSYGNGLAPSLSAIDLTNGNVKELKDALITNPVDLFAVNGALYILDSGTYDANWNQVGAGLKKLVNGNVTDVTEATLAAVSGNNIYIVNAPYGASTISYGVLDTTTGQVSAFPIVDGDKPFNPVAIAADPLTGNVFITSNHQNPDTGYADFRANGYVNIYDKNAKLTRTYSTGVSPTAVAFNVGTRYE